MRLLSFILCLSGEPPDPGASAAHQAEGSGQDPGWRKMEPAFGTGTVKI